MTKNLIEEIKKINFYTKYNRNKTINENTLILEQAPNLLLKLSDELGSLGGKKFAWTNIQFWSKGVAPNAGQIIESFKLTFKDSNAFAKLEKKLGTGGANDLVRRFYEAGSIKKLGRKDFINLVEAMGDHTLGAVTVKQVVADALKSELGYVIQTIKLLDDPVEKVATKDASEILSRFSDEFLDDILGTGLVKARKPKVKVKTDDVVVPPVKTPTKTQKFWKSVKEKFNKWFTRGSKGYKSRLAAAVTWSLDKFFIYFGTATLLTIFKGPLLGLLGTFLINATIGKLFSKIGKKIGIDKMFNRQSAAKGRQILDDGTLSSWMDQGISFLRLPTKLEAGIGKLDFSVGLSRGYWMTLTAIGLFYQLYIKNNATVQRALGYIHGMLGSGIDLMKSGVWTSKNVTAALTGGLYNSVGGAEGVQNLGLEFDDDVIDESADMLNDLLSYWEGLPGPMDTGMFEGVLITKDDLENAEKMVIEWLENCPSLLFVSAVSGRMEEKHGKNLLKSINDYEIWAETIFVENLLPPYDDWNWKRVINMKEVVRALQGKPLFQKELDEFIVELYDSVTTGRDSQIVLQAIQDIELSVDEKKDILRAAMSPMIELLNQQLGDENKTSFNEMLTQWDGESAIFSFEEGAIDELLKAQKVADMAPMEGSLYWVQDGNSWKIATKDTKNVNNSIVEIRATRQKLDLEDLVGSNRTFKQSDIDTSFPKGIIYYVQQYGKRGYKAKDFCDALEEKMGWDDNKFQGGKCQGKHFKQMPILKTIAATEMSELTKDKKIALSTRKKSLEMMFKKEFPELESTVDDLKDRIEENKIIGLETILLEYRKK